MTGPQPIHNLAGPYGLQPNLVDYQAAYARFSWEEARRELSGLPRRRSLNIAHEAVDRHATGPSPDERRVSLRCRLRKPALQR
jgi:acetyl-CoA synthetase